MFKIEGRQPTSCEMVCGCIFCSDPDYRSHTGAVMTLGEGSIIAMSRKRKLNTRSSTEAELVGADDAATMILWTGLFMEH